MKLTLSILFVCSSVFINAQELYFPPLLGNQWDSLEIANAGWCEDKVAALDQFLDDANSKGFIVLKDGKRALELYYDDFTTSSQWYWASAGKTMTAFLTGLTQEKGLLNINDATSSYLGNGWTSCTSAEEDNITIRHQLTMTTGLDYTVPDPFCLAPECLQCLNEPGSEWFYHNAPYTHISNVIEAATGETYSNYTNTEVAFKIGFLGIWTFLNDTRLFWSNTRGMARFGLLMLNEGNWNGDQIMEDQVYFQDMITPSQNINPSYGYLWWLNGQDGYRLPGSTIDFAGKLIPNAPDDLYAAVGKNGQILMVVPSEHLVLVRMGENPDQSLVPISFVRDLWDEFAKVYCTTATDELNSIAFEISPNPTRDQLSIVSEEAINLVKVYSLSGNLLLTSENVNLDVQSLNNGMYILQVFADGKSASRKFVKR